MYTTYENQVNLRLCMLELYLDFLWLQRAALKRYQMNPIQCITIKRTVFVQNVGYCYMVVIM